MNRPRDPLEGSEGVVDQGGPGDRSIGSLLADTLRLDAEQIERILAWQREHGVRFGEAAVALGYARTDDVLFALAQQYHYPMAAEERRQASPELVTLNDAFGTQAEAFRAIRSQAMMRVWGAMTPPGGPAPRALAVLSPSSGDGKTFFAANLAVTLAQLGGRTLLVDADLRGPRLHEVFGLPNPSGLSGILSGRADRHVVQRVPGVPSLFLLPAGPTPPNPLELVERPAFARLVTELCSRFEHVVVDTPAHEFGADGPVIASRCGSAVLVARRNASRLAALQRLLGASGAGPVRVVGVVLNEFAG